MAQQALIGDIGDHVGREVTIRGWLYSKTDKGRLQFLMVRDGTGVIQCVAFQRELSTSAFADAQNATQESSLIVSGIVRADERAPGGYDLGVTDLQVLQLAGEYPITPKDHGIDFLMDHRHLWLRSTRQWAILRTRATIIRAIRQWLDSQGFLNVDTPILTPSACEGSSTLFETDYFGQPAYLAQSGQLYSEASIMSLGRVYCFGPTFRAEKSKTRRHLTEFWMVEPEMAYCDLDECMDIAERFVCHIVKTTLEERQAELSVLQRDTDRLKAVLPPFPRVSYDDAVDLLVSQGMAIQWGDDLGAPHETALGEHFEKPVFIHHYPTSCKAFYMESDPQRPELSLSVDLVANEGFGEIIGGGQRTASLELLEHRLAEHKLPRQAYEWYLDLRRYGSVPHSGFGLGLERTVAWICGLPHIRETIPFPRTLGRMYP